MGFETPIFLAALAAVAAPVIIHLIFRLRKRVVLFGSLRFLERIVKKNRKRLRLRDLILLLLRVAAVALIALAFARPYLTGSGAEGEGERRDVVFVLDDSFSMSAGRLARANLDEAKARIIDELSTLGPRDRAALVVATGGGRVAAALTGEHYSVQAKVRAAPPTFERAELAPALRAAAGLLGASNAPVRRVAVASDLQRTSWTEAALAPLPKEGIEYAVILPAANEPNLAVVGAEPATDFWTPGVPVRVRARVANFGPKSAAVSVRLRAGEREAPRAQTTVEVAAGDVAPVELAFDAAAAGEYPALVEIDGRDALPADDVRHLVIRLRGRLAVLCVQDEILRGRSRYDDASFFLRMSLDPKAGRGDPAETPFAPKAVESRLLAASDLREADAVCTVGATKLPDEAVEDLAEWVRAGGGLLIAPSGDGRTFDAFARFVNGRLAAAGLAPARVAGVSDAGVAYPEGIPISSWERDHPVWAAFREAKGTGPDRARARRYLKLDPAEGSRVMAEFDLARPAVVGLGGGAGDESRDGRGGESEDGREEERGHERNDERKDERKVGRGRVVLLAFALDGKSTDFPKRKAYVPFVHGLAGYLARSGEREALRAVEVGEPLPAAEALAGPGRAGERAELLAPDGSTVPFSPATPRERGTAAPLAERPGLYRLRVRRRGGARTTYLAANAPAAESDLRTDGAEKFLAAAGSRGAAAGGGVGLSRAPSEEKAPSSIWAVLLALVGGILIIESLLANRVLLGGERSEAGSPAAAGAAEAGPTDEGDAGSGEAA